MGIINKLDEHLINMIAAGEVVERPSGIIKELIENSIDANASFISVYIKEGGLSSIEVVDNGKGMDASDAQLAFYRHATSKIIKEIDLFSIKSLGFRGEAIPSIASVSKTKLTTNDGNESTEVLYEYGKLISAKPISFNKGTSVEVTGLFYKTPARLKHLKQAAYESALVNEVVTKFALGYPHIGFELYSDDKLVVKSSGNNKVSDVIFNTYGKEYASNAIVYQNADQDFKIEGVMCLPHLNRANKNYIHLFINNRMIRYYKITQAIIDVYQRYMPHNRYPIVTLNIIVDEKLVDVNVHPSKWQIRLSKEQELLELIKATLNEYLLVNLRGLNIEVKPQIPEVVVPIIKEEIEEIALNFEEEATKKEEVVDTYVNKPIENIEIKEEEVVYTKAHINEHEELANLTVIGQLDEKYVLAQSPIGLFIFDQHAAMERIKYEYYLKAFDNQEVATIDLLVPIKLFASPKIINNLEQVNKAFNKLKINLEIFGINDVLIRSVPDWMVELNAAEFIKSLLDYYENHQKLNVEDLTKHKIATMACHNSIRFNEKIGMDEMRQLLNDLRKCDNPYQCPHSRPTFNKISYYELEKSFKR